MVPSVAVYSELYHYRITIEFVPDNNFLGVISITSHRLYARICNFCLSCRKALACTAYSLAFHINTGHLAISSTKYVFRGDGIL
jgi:hypothetical protein